MAGYANITIVGNVGKDPEEKETKAGKLAKFSVVVSTRKDAETQWFSVAAWGKTADVVMSYVKKGGSVLVSGSLKVGSYQAKDGTTKTTLEVDCKDLVLLGSKRDGGDARPTNTQKFQSPPQPVADDDLPF